MAACAECGDSSTFLFSCPFCDSRYCPDHHAVEDHGCPSMDRIGGEGSTSSEHTSSPDDSDDSLDWKNLTIWVFGLTVIIGALAGGYVLTGYGTDIAESELLRSVPGVENRAMTAADLNLTDVEGQVRSNINQHRSDADSQRLPTNATLREVAAYHSEDMATKGYINHTSPSGQTVVDRYERFDLTCSNKGEVILYTYYDRSVETASGTTRYTTEAQLANGIVDLLMESPQHRRTVLDPNWQTMGVGLATDDSNKVYVTVNFC